jgi:hypothetical protein
VLGAEEEESPLEANEDKSIPNAGATKNRKSIYDVIP